MDSSSMMHDGQGKTHFDNQLLDDIKQRRTTEALHILKSTPNASHLADIEGRALLHAVQSGNNDVVWHLTTSGDGKCELQLSLETGYARPVLEALQFEYFSDVGKIAEKLISFNCSVYSALTLNNSRLIALLLEHACPLVPPNSSLCPGDVLVKAVKNFDLESVKILLDYKVDIDAEDSNGDTALSSCSKKLIYANDIYANEFPHCYNDVCIPVFQLLLDRGANPNKIGKACKGEMPMEKFLRDGAEEAIQILLKFVDLSATDENGRTALHHAALSRHPRIYASLKDREWNPNARDKDGSTPLHYINVKNVHNAMSLLDMGADLHAKNNAGMTALMSIWQRHRFAAFVRTCLLERSKQLVEHLLYRGADVQAVASDGKFSLFKNCSMDKVCGRYHVHWMPSVLAHLAMIEARGTALLKHVKKSISKRKILKKRFETRKKQLKRMKNVKIWGSISLYQLLIEKDYVIERYARNVQFLRKLDRIQFKNKYVPYYRYILRNRLMQAAKIVRMRKKVAADLSKLIGVSYIIASKIVDYINESDLRKMIVEE